MAVAVLVNNVVIACRRIIDIGFNMAEILVIISYTEIKSEVARQHYCISYTQLTCKSGSTCVSNLYRIADVCKQISLAETLYRLVSQRRENRERVEVELRIARRAYTNTGRQLRQNIITGCELKGMSTHAEVLTAHRMSGKSLGQSKIIIIIKVNVEL